MPSALNAVFAAAAVPDGNLVNLDAGDCLRLGIDERIVDRDPHVRLRGVMAHDLDPGPGEDLLEPLVAQVAVEELRPRGHVLPPAGDQAVEHQEAVPRREKGIGQVRTDEARAAGQENGRHP